MLLDGLRVQLVTTPRQTTPEWALSVLDDYLAALASPVRLGSGRSRFQGRVIRAVATVDLEAGGYHYAEYGDPSAPPLVLLHGMPSDCSTWAGVAPELAAGYRVIAPDQRGHGASARTGTYSLEEMREDLRQLADALGLDRFVLGGHSMGGTVATLFAERYPAGWPG